jgi:hypothetical protein
MKIESIFGILMLMLICMPPALGAEPEYVLPEKFRELASLPMGTMRYSQYLGVSNGKACVVLHEMSWLDKRTWSKTLYCSDAKEIGSSFLDSLSPAEK